MASSPSESESTLVTEDEGVIPLKTRAQFSETLEKIRSRDASIYDADAAFFETPPSSVAESSSEEDEPTLYIKDVRARQLLEFGASAYSSEEEDGEEQQIDDLQKFAQEKKKRLLYNKEQTENREMLLNALEAGSDSSEEQTEFGGLLKVESSKDDLALVNPEIRKSKETTKRCLDSYFAHTSDLKGEDAAFLRDYIEKEVWRVDKWGGEDDIDEGIEFDEDEKFLEEGAKFEADYNYRFEEPGSHQVVGHPRSSEGSLRKTESKRKRQRANKAERRHKQKLKEEQEIKEQKNLKRKEIQQKLTELNKACGASMEEDILQRLLDSDQEFDVEEWDARMEQTFNDEYYKKDDAKFPLSEEEKRFEKCSTKQQNFKRDALDLDEDIGERETSTEEHRHELVSLMQQYYKLDREDTIGGIKCRYRYVKVPKEDFGLSPHDVLCLDDKKLNDYVGLRRLNPYRDDLTEYKYRPWKLKQLLSEVDYSGYQASSRSKTEDSGHNERLPSLDDEEAELAKKIDQESDPNIKARLESYSHETLKSYSGKKQRSSDKEAALKTKEVSGFEGMSKSQKKNMKRMRRRQEKRNNSMT